MLQLKQALSKGRQWTSARNASGAALSVGNIFRADKIGDRQVVGFGINGRPEYIDNRTFPFPAIKFSRPTAEFKALEEKAKGDWKLMTTEEKKRLYRLNYCQTFAEIDAPTGQWKSIMGFWLMWLSAAMWLHLFIEYVRYPEGEGIPKSFSEENQKAQLRRIIDLQINPITGISSKWDYERNMWKKDVPKDAKD